MMARQLQSESREMRRLALRGLMVLSRDPSMVRRRQRLQLCCQRGAGESSPVGLAGLWELWQLLPVLLLCRSAA